MTSGEYIQMSGRAGRRGKDDRGLVIVCADETLDEPTYRGLVKGKPSPIVSSFKLTYYTLLNLIKRAEGGHQSMEHVIRHSFQQYQQERGLPLVRTQLDGLKTHRLSYFDNVCWTNSWTSVVS